MGVKCEKCGSSNIRVGVDVFMVIPPEYVHNLSKQAVRHKDVRLSSASWDKACIVCMDCHYVHKGC